MRCMQAAKAAIETITPVLARELRGKSITVNAVAPGPTATALFRGGKTPEAIERLAQAAPLERLGTTADIANSVAFLVSEPGGLGQRTDAARQRRLGLRARRTAAADASQRHPLETLVKSTLLVTGASSGIGRLSACSLAAAGHTVHASVHGGKQEPLSRPRVARWGACADAGLARGRVGRAVTEQRGRRHRNPHPEARPTGRGEAQRRPSDHRSHRGPFTGRDDRGLRDPRPGRPSREPRGAAGAPRPAPGIAALVRQHHPEGRLPAIRGPLRGGQGGDGCHRGHDGRCRRRSCWPGCQTGWTRFEPSGSTAGNRTALSALQRRAGSPSRRPRRSPWPTFRPRWPSSNGTRASTARSSSRSEVRLAAAR